MQTGNLKAEYINSRQKISPTCNEGTIPSGQPLQNQLKNVQSIQNNQLLRAQPFIIIHDQKVELEQKTHFQRQLRCFSIFNLCFFIFILATVISRMFVLINYTQLTIGKVAIYLLPSQCFFAFLLACFNQFSVSMNKDRKQFRKQYLGVASLILEIIASVCVFISFALQESYQQNVKTNQKLKSIGIDLLVMFIIFFISVVVGYIVLFIFSCILNSLIIDIFGEDPPSIYENAEAIRRHGSAIYNGYHESEEGHGGDGVDVVKVRGINQGDDRRGDVGSHS